MRSHLHTGALLLSVLLAPSATGQVAEGAPPAPPPPIKQSNRASEDSPASPAEIGRPHPALELDVLDGSLVNQARLAGRPFIVDFFATWCEPCHRALADLQAARAAMPGAEDITVVLVDLGEAPEIVRRWAARAGLPQNTLVTLDPAGVAARRWGARRLPTTFLVDAAGVVRHINRGWGPGYRARLSRWLPDLTPRTVSP